MSKETKNPVILEKTTDEIVRSYPAATAAQTILKDVYSSKKHPLITMTLVKVIAPLEDLLAVNTEHNELVPAYSMLQVPVREDFTLRKKTLVPDQKDCIMLYYMLSNGTYYRQGIKLTGTRPAYVINPETHKRLLDTEGKPIPVLDAEGKHKLETVEPIWAHLYGCLSQYHYLEKKSKFQTADGKPDPKIIVSTYEHLIRSNENTINCRINVSAGTFNGEASMYYTIQPEFQAN